MQLEHCQQYLVKDIFHGTFSIGAFWDKDERFKFWGQKLKVQVSK